MTTTHDVTFVASRLRSAADALDAHGLTALQTTSQWARGAGTANYDPESGGNRWEQDEDDGTVWPVPSDPTGDRALRRDVMDHAHAKYCADLTKALAAADALITDVETATPHTPKQIGDHDKLAAQVGAEGWCSSCFRNAGRMEPQAMHGNGTIRYRGECRWCHDFKAEQGRYPTLSLLQKHHSRRPITAEDIARALGQPFKAKQSTT